MSDYLSPEQLAGLIAKLSEPSGAERDLRERIKLAIQTAQDSEGRLLYIIPPGVAGMYADAVMLDTTDLGIEAAVAAAEAIVRARLG